jgi:GntR family transcriptional regulator of vanillate catabolism
MAVQLKAHPAPRSKSAHERCTHEIIDAVRSGQFRPGERLSEGVIARKLKVGRAAVRVAFNRLAWAGIVERVSRSGTYLRRFSLVDYDEIIELRGGLEAMAAARACVFLSEEEVDRLSQVARRLDKLEAEVDRRTRASPAALARAFAELEELEKEFHRGIVQASATRHILPILDNYHLLERSFLVGMSLPEGHATRVRRAPPHRDIAEALRRRKPELVRRTVERHYRLLRANLMARFAHSALIEADRAALPIKGAERTRLRRQRNGER